MNTKNAFFAARRRSKKTAGKMANSGTNAVIAASVLTAENGSIYKRFGRTTARASRLPPSSPRNTKGVVIQGIVCDGRKGLLQLFPEIPAQLCQFHQVKTVSRYLTRNPKTAAGKALWQLALTLKDSGKVAFQSALQAWFERHQGFLNERTVNEENGRSHYTHRVLRRWDGKSVTCVLAHLL